MLTVETTPFEAGVCPPQRARPQRKATVREHFIRNGDILTIVTIVTDPVYLTEPLHQEP